MRVIYKTKICANYYMNMIVACDEHYGIGINNQLPQWNLKEDMRRFKRLTTSGSRTNVVVMGKNTCLSLGKPLPERFNIVISKSLFSDNGGKSEMMIEHNGFHIFKDIKYAFHCAKNIGEVWVIGGAQLYEYVIQEFPLNNIYVTLVDGVYDCDTFLKKNTVDLITHLKWTTDEPYTNGKNTCRFLSFERKNPL